MGGLRVAFSVKKKIRLQQVEVKALLPDSTAVTRRITRGEEAKREAKRSHWACVAAAMAELAGREVWVGGCQVWVTVQFSWEAVAGRGPERSTPVPVCDGSNTAAIGRRGDSGVVV